MATVGRVGTVKGVGSPPYLCFSPSSCPALGSLGAQLSSPPVHTPLPVPIHW